MQPYLQIFHKIMIHSTETRSLQKRLPFYFILNWVWTPKGSTTIYRLDRTVSWPGAVSIPAQTAETEDKHADTVPTMKHLAVS